LIQSREIVLLFQGKFDGTISHLIVYPKDEPMALIFDKKSRVFLFTSTEIKIFKLIVFPFQVQYAFVMTELQRIYVVSDKNIISQCTLGNTMITMNSSLKLPSGMIEMHLFLMPNIYAILLEMLSHFGICEQLSHKI
jgi:hypothetical protein